MPPHHIACLYRTSCKLTCKVPYHTSIDRHTTTKMADGDQLASILARRAKINEGEEAAVNKSATVFNPFTAFPVWGMGGPRAGVWLTCASADG